MNALDTGVEAANSGTFQARIVIECAQHGTEPSSGCEQTEDQGQAGASRARQATPDQTRVPSPVVRSSVISRSQDVACRREGFAPEFDQGTIVEFVQEQEVQLRGIVDLGGE